MTDKELIEDTGLFIGQNIFEFSLEESFESITNLYQTIKEYREFTDPDQDSWFDYIHQIFHIFGFNTEKVAPRLISLKEMGASDTLKALVCIIGPKEDFDQIIYGLGWESYLFYAAKYHQVAWVILTNGLEFKVLNFGENVDHQKYFKCELDAIIKNDQTDSFFTLYKIFSVINQDSESEKQRTKGKRTLSERHHTRREFWTQLLALLKGKTDLFSNKSPGIESYLDTGTGKTGIAYTFLITTIRGSRIQLYIDNGDKEWNKITFDKLNKGKSKIEEVFGDSLVWDRLDDNRASIIRYQVSEYGLQDKDKWLELQEELIKVMIRFEKALKPFIARLS